MGVEFLQSTDALTVRAGLHDVLRAQTCAKVVAASEQYYALGTSQQKDEFLTTQPADQLAALTHFWANRAQLSTRAANIAAQNALGQQQGLMRETLAVAQQEVVPQPERPGEGATFQEWQQYFRAQEQAHPVMTVPVPQESVHEALRTAKDRGVSFDEAVRHVQGTVLELIFTEHPTDPLSVPADRAIRGITARSTEEELVAHVQTLATQELVPHQKRTVDDEVKRDIASLQGMYHLLPALRESVHHAFRTYYPEEYAANHAELDAAMGLFSPAQREQAQGSKGIIPSGGWAGFDADGNSEMYPECTLDAIRQRRKTALKEHAQFVEAVILPQLESPALEAAREAYRAHAAQLQAFAKDATDGRALPPGLTKQAVLDQHFGIWEQHQEQIHQHAPEADAALKLYTGQLVNFGLSMGRGDIRQKSYMNTAVLTVVLEDHKHDPEFRDTPLFAPLRDRSFAQLSEEEKMHMLKVLQNGDPVGQRVIAKTRENFEAGRYHDHPNEVILAHLADQHPFTSFKESPLKIAQQELSRTVIAAQNADVVQKNIISNTEQTSDLFTQDVLRKVFGSQHQIRTVPLLESMHDLERAEGILETYLRFQVQCRLEEAYDQSPHRMKQLLSGLGDNVQHRDDIGAVLAKGRDHFRALREKSPALNGYLQGLVLETMAGFSDSERESSTAALISIDESIARQQRLANDYGASFRLFRGPGADIGRGGETRAGDQQTGQGNFKRNVIPDEESLLRKTERQFSHAVVRDGGLSRATPLSPGEQGALQLYKKASAEHYEHLYDSEAGLGKLAGVLYGIGPHHRVTSDYNVSSRASMLGKKAPNLFVPLEKLRAITKTWDDEVARHYTNLNMGPGAGLEAIGEREAVQLYAKSETFRDIVTKTAVGVALTDWDAEWRNFPQQYRPYGADGQLDVAQLEQMAARVQGYPARLREGVVEEGLRHGPGSGQFDQVIAMTADLNAYLHLNYLCTADRTFAVLREVHRSDLYERHAGGHHDPVTVLASLQEEKKQAEVVDVAEVHQHQAVTAYRRKALPDRFDPQNPTCILFHMPQLQAHYCQTLPEVEPLTRLTAHVNRGLLVEGRDFSEMHPRGAEKADPAGPDYRQQILGNVAAGTEAFRSDPPGHREPTIWDQRRDHVRHGTLRAKKEFGGQSPRQFADAFLQGVDQTFAESLQRRQAAGLPVPLGR